MSAQVMYHPQVAAARNLAAALPAARIHFDPISENGFFAALKAKVDAYMTGKRPDGGLFVAGKAAFYLALAAALYLMALFAGFSGAVTLAFAVAAGVAAILMAINAGHDGAHNIVSRQRWLNQAALNASFTQGLQIDRRLGERFLSTVRDELSPEDARRLQDAVARAVRDGDTRLFGDLDFACSVTAIERATVFRAVANRVLGDLRVEAASHRPLASVPTPWSIALSESKSDR